jgi:hypothetical protein
MRGETKRRSNNRARPEFLAVDTASKPLLNQGTTSFGTSADAVIDYTQEDFVQRVKALTDGKGT